MLQHIHIYGDKIFYPFFFKRNKQIFIKKRNDMRVNINHPSFITFLDGITNNILSSVKYKTYFSLPDNKKISIQYFVLKIMKNSFKTKAKLSDEELRSFVVVLWKKNEEKENFELAAILNDIRNNFDKINELSTPKKNKIQPIKSDTIES